MPTLNMTETAYQIGYGWEHFRKIWRTLVSEQGFPSPIVGRRWDKEEVEAWYRARHVPRKPPVDRPHTAPQDTPAAPKRQRTERDRALDAWRRL